MDESKPLDSTNKSVLFGKMARVMGIVTRVRKNAHNTYHDYDYAAADDVADMVRKAMAEVGLAFYINMVSIKKEAVGKELRTHAVFEFTFGCSETGATLTCRWEAEADDTKDKGINKVATAAEKYFLLKTFVIGTGDEPDADSDGGESDQPTGSTSATGNGSGSQQKWQPRDEEAKKFRVNLIATVGQEYRSSPQERIDAINALEADPNGFKGCVNFEDHVKVVIEYLKKAKAPVPYGQNPAANVPPPGVEMETTATG